MPAQRPGPRDELIARSLERELAGLRAEVVAALGYGEGVKPRVPQGRILWGPEARSDVFLVEDLHKTERD